MSPAAAEPRLHHRARRYRGSPPRGATVSTTLLLLRHPTHQRGPHAVLSSLSPRSRRLTPGSGSEPAGHRPLLRPVPFCSASAAPGPATRPLPGCPMAGRAGGPRWPRRHPAPLPPPPRSGPAALRGCRRRRPIIYAESPANKRRRRPPSTFPLVAARWARGGAERARVERRGGRSGLCGDPEPPGRSPPFFPAPEPACAPRAQRVAPRW